MNTPIWFDTSYYMHEKYTELVAKDPSWTVATMQTAFDNVGLTPFMHYQQFGDKENISPNVLFNQEDYLRNKANAMGSGISEQWVLDTIHNAGMSLAEHYDMFGFKEGINPSADFSQSKYLQAKLYQVQATDSSMTLDKLVRAFDNAGLTAVEHYLLFAKIERITEADANRMGFSYSVDDIRPVYNPNKPLGFTYTIDHNSNKVRTITVEEVFTEHKEDGTVHYALTKNTVDLTTTTEVTNVTITGSQNMDLSDVLAMLQGT